MYNSNCQTFQPPPQIYQPPPQIYQPPPQVYQPPPQTICMPPPPVYCCPPPPPPPVIVEKPVYIDRPMSMPPPPKPPKTKVIVIDRPTTSAPASPIIIDRERNDNDCCKWCPGLFGLLGLLGLLCCLMSLFHKQQKVTPPAPQPIVPPPLPPKITPDTLDPIPFPIPITPVKPQIMDPVKATPIGIKDCDKTVVGSSIDPTVTAATGKAPAITYVQPHSIDPVITNPNAALPTAQPFFQAPPVRVNPDTINPYVTNPIETRVVVNASTIQPIRLNLTAQQLIRYNSTFSQNKNVNHRLQATLSA